MVDSLSLGSQRAESIPSLLLVLGPSGARKLCVLDRWAIALLMRRITRASDGAPGRPKGYGGRGTVDGEKAAVIFWIS